MNSKTRVSQGGKKAASNNVSAAGPKEIEVRKAVVLLAAQRIHEAVAKARAMLPDEDPDELEAEIWGLATERESDERAAG